MRRGDIVTVALSGDLGKPRLALIVESDRLAPTAHVLICTATSHVRSDIDQRRVLIEPDAENGLRAATQFQIDKITPVRREKCGPVIGRITPAALDGVNEKLFIVLGLAD